MEMSAFESPSKNQKFSKVNIKSTICHVFPSPELLEGPKDEKLCKVKWAGECDRTPFIDRAEYYIS